MTLSSWVVVLLVWQPPSADALKDAAGLIKKLMQIRNIPFFLVLVSCLVPLIGAFLNVNVFRTQFILSAIALSLVFVQTRKLYVINNAWMIFAACTLLFLVAFQIVTGRGYIIIATGGLVLILAFVYCSLFLNGTGCDVEEIIDNTSFVYKFLTIGITIEAIVILFGFQSQLALIIGKSYISHNSAELFNYLGFQVTGLNSILLANQIAGMLSLFSTIWFLGIAKVATNNNIVKNSRYWAALSILNYIFASNGLSTLLLVIAIGIYALIVEKQHRKLYAFAMCLFLFGLYLLVDRGMLLGKIFNYQFAITQADKLIFSKYTAIGESDSLPGLEYYRVSFFSPLIYWNSEGIIDKVFGLLGQEFLAERSAMASECGICVGLVTTGLVWIIVFCGAVLGICLPGLKAIDDCSEFLPWLVLRQVNSVITILWGLSSIHYTYAFTNSGGVALFAMHLAIAAYSHNRLVKLKFKSISLESSQNSTAHS